MAREAGRRCVRPTVHFGILDTLLAGHYGLTAEDLDFIRNYDINYRLGRDTESEEE
ncbi:MAG: hypothetical protein WCQ21_21785 [Verrucomicrobiota bacterium]